MNKALSKKLRILAEKAAEKPMIDVHFYTVGKEESIAICAFEGLNKECLLLSSGIEIPLGDIISIEGEIFCE